MRNPRVLANRERAHGVVVSHPLSMREALGSIPSVSIFVLQVISAMASRPRSDCKQHVEQVELSRSAGQSAKAAPRQPEPTAAKAAPKPREAP